jgi:ATP-dependent exoDNAse (exonuclease V) beta subunit
VSARLPADQSVRDRVTSDFETTFLLEAGAGTGKTTVLVKRILALLRAGRAPIDRIVAITFTDKAAGELKGRLRDDIEKALESASGDESEQLSRAAADLERAPVSTIHAFASSLLRERPFEAGLDPGFAVAAEVASDRTFDDAWEAWLEVLMAEGDAVLVRAMACDLKLDALKDAARTVVKERDILGREEKAPPFGVDSLLDRVRSTVATLQALKRKCVDRDDEAYRSVLDLESDLAQAERLDPASRERFFRELHVVYSRGQQGNWNPKEACKETKEELKAVRKAQEAYLAASSAHLAWALRDRLRGFLAAYETAKSDAAVVDFQDLLLRARDVLQSSIPVRRYFQRRFDFVLVDEFQDTDPLQAEIAFLLAEDPEGEPASDWRGCRLKPGKLFVVGDPKQSIYRFRRADIAVYEEAKRLVERSGGETLALTTNFRTVPSIVAFVNERFGEVFADRDLDPEPRPLVAFRDEVDKGGARTLALAVPPERLPEDGDRKVGTVVPLVAATVAAFLDEITRVRPWSVRDEDRVRPARPGDVALLVRRMSPDFIEHYERAFATQGVPFRLVGGKDYYARDEVRALANVLRAVDNPADRLAVFAALRSPFFGFSDDDLWQLMAKGGALNYLAPVPPGFRGATALVAAFELLTSLHRLRRVRPPTDVIVRLFEKTRALAAYRLRPEGDQLVANLWKTLDVARAYEAAGPTTLRALVRYLEEETEGGAEEGDSPVGDQAGAQVEVVTVHKAKGLEYPIVVLGDILYGNPPAAKSVLRHAEGRGWVKIGGFEPEGWDEAVAAEKLQAAAEDRRLLYVALTRARDHLVVPCLPGEIPKGWMSPIVQGFVEPGKPAPFGAKASTLVEGGTKNGKARVTFVDSPALTFAGAAADRVSSMAPLDGSEEDLRRAVESERLWQAKRKALSFRGASVESGDEESETPADPSGPGASKSLGMTAAAGDSAAVFGALVHALLALPEFPEGDALARTASTLAAQRGLDAHDAAEAADLAKRVRALPALAAIGSADVVYREVPFVYRTGGQVLDGRIDLAYRVAGSWTVIDFKTARLGSAAEARARFGEQLRRYRTALAALTGEPVTASLCLVRTGELVPVEER